MMNRLLLSSAALMFATAGAYAGPVTIALTGLNANLASGYMPCVNSGCTPNIGTTNSLVTNPPSGSSVGFSTVLFNSAEVPFNIASGGADNPAGGPSGGGNTPNVWSPGNTAVTKTNTQDLGNFTGSTPDAAGLFNVDQIWTLLNDELGNFGYQGISLILTGFNPNTSATITETIDLEDGVDYRSIGTGPNLTTADYPVTCDVANIGTSTLGSNCTGETSPRTTASATDSRSSLSSMLGVTVTVYNNAFETSDTGFAAPDSYGLDVQNIMLGNPFLGNYLNTIQVVNKGTAGTNEDVVLAGITVDATPEPGTVLLFGTGIAGLLVLQLRRSKKA
jgi:hypothetical protein